MVGTYIKELPYRARRANPEDPLTILLTSDGDVNHDQINLDADEIIGGMPKAKHELPHFKTQILKAQFCRGVPDTLLRKPRIDRHSTNGRWTLRGSTDQTISRSTELGNKTTRINSFMPSTSPSK